MSKQKLCFIVITSLLVGILATVLFFYCIGIRQYLGFVVQPAVPVNPTSTHQNIASIESSTATDQKQKLAIYRNREYGFEFQYPLEWVATENFYNKPLDWIVSIGARSENGQTGELYNWGVYKIKKQSVEEFVNKNNLPQGTYAGLPAFYKFYGGEGSEDGDIFLPTKGIKIHHPRIQEMVRYLDGKEQLLDDIIVQGFKFFDRRYLIKNELIGISFWCNAFWTCEKSTYSTFDGLEPKAGYDLTAPQFSLEIVFSTTTYTPLDALLSQMQKQYKEDKKEYDQEMEKFDQCEKAKWPVYCFSEFYQGIASPPPATIQKVDFIGLPVILEDFLDGSKWTFFIPNHNYNLKIQMRANNGSFKITRELLQEIFVPGQIFTRP